MHTTHKIMSYIVFTPKPRAIAISGDVQNFIPWCKKQEGTYKRAMRAYILWYALLTRASAGDLVQDSPGGSENRMPYKTSTRYSVCLR